MTSFDSAKGPAERCFGRWIYPEERPFRPSRQTSFAWGGMQCRRRRWGRTAFSGSLNGTGLGLGTAPPLSPWGEVGRDQGFPVPTNPGGPTFPPRPKIPRPCNPTLKKITGFPAPTLPPPTPTRISKPPPAPIYVPLPGDRPFLRTTRGSPAPDTSFATLRLPPHRSSFFLPKFPRLVPGPFNQTPPRASPAPDVLHTSPLTRLKGDPHQTLPTPPPFHLPPPLSSGLGASESKADLGRSTLGAPRTGPLTSGSRLGLGPNNPTPQERKVHPSGRASLLDPIFSSGALTLPATRNAHSHTSPSGPARRDSHKGHVVSFGNKGKNGLTRRICRLV